MAVQDILVLIENAGSVASRVAAAAAIASSSGARVSGLFATGYPISASYGDFAGWPQLIDAYLAAQRSAGAAAEAVFRQAIAARQLQGEWLYREEDATMAATGLAALHDLVIAGQNDPGTGPEGLAGLQPEQVVLGCGRPVIVVPYTGAFPEIGRRVVVAWNASREATRALHDSMFLLEAAEAVTIIEVDPPESFGGVTRISAADIAAGLTRRGIAATAQTETAGDISVDALLLSRAADLAADLLVMGGYGHSRLREFVLGGVSRGIFQQMTIPVLMSH